MNANGANGGPAALARYAADRLGVEPDKLAHFLDEYMDLQVLYRSAIREVSNRLEVLDDEFQFRNKRNPIHNIQTRLKTPRSMLEKLGRRNLQPNLEVLRTELTDIAGIRVICPYVNDIYRLHDLLCAQDGVELIRVHDYIKNPKLNGYRSLHIVVTVPVQLSDGCHRVPVEIQIRTIAMDFWASLEHDLHYKSSGKISRELVKELRNCAEDVAALDERMQGIYLKMEQMEEKDSPRACGNEE